MASDPARMAGGNGLSVAEAAFVGIAFMFLPVAAYGNHGIVILLVVAGLASLWQTVRHGGRGWPLGRAMSLGLAAFLAWGGASTLWAETPGIALPRVLQLAGLTAAGVAVLSALPALDHRARHRVGMAMVFGMLGLFTAVGVDGGVDGAIERAVRRLLGLRVPEEWLRSHFKVGVTLCGLLMPVMAMWLWRRRPWIVPLLVAGLVGCGLSVDSNTGLLAAGIASVVTGLALVWPRAICAGMAVLVTIGFLAAPAAVQRLPGLPAMAEAVNILPNSMMHRLGIWGFAAGKVGERPLAGWGLDASRALPGGEAIIKVPARASHGIIMLDVQAMPLHPHNLMLQVWLETGLLGVVLLLSAFLALIMALWRSPPAVRAPGLGTAAGILVIGAASFGAWQAWWVASQWLVATFCLILSDPATRDLSAAPPSS